MERDEARDPPASPRTLLPHWSTTGSERAAYMRAGGANWYLSSWPFSKRPARFGSRSACGDGYVALELCNRPEAGVRIAARDEAMRAETHRYLARSTASGLSPEQRRC
jgi:hypothetical protein